MKTSSRKLASLLLVVGFGLQACVARPATSLPAPGQASGLAAQLPQATSILLNECDPAGDCQLRAFDPQTASDSLNTPPLAMGKYQVYHFSNNGQTLAVLSFRSNLFGPGGGPTDGAL
jgi:hypothetical protein